MELNLKKMPQRSKQHISAGRAITAVQDALPDAWIMRQEPQELDYGIDLEVEIASEFVTGRLFKAQVKGHSSIGWNSRRNYVQSIREKTLNYWNAIPLPVVVFVVDHSKREVYWTPGKRDEKAAGVRVHERNVLSRTVADLESFVIDWLDARGEMALLYSLPQYNQVWDRLRECVDYDFFLPVSQGEYYDLELLYRQTAIFRDMLGLHVDLLPWALWISRSRVILGESENLYWGVYDEIVAYLEPIVESIMERGRKRLNSERPSLNNLAALHWMSNYTIEHRIRYDFERESKSFWAKIDDKLERVGARRLMAADGVKFGRKAR